MLNALWWAARNNPVAVCGAADKAVNTLAPDLSPWAHLAEGMILAGTGNVVQSALPLSLFTVQMLCRLIKKALKKKKPKDTEPIEEGWVEV